MARAAGTMVKAVNSACALGTASAPKCAAAAAGRVQATCPTMGAGHAIYSDPEASRLLNAAVTRAEVSKALLECRNGSAPGGGAITYEVLKALPLPGLDRIAHLYNVVLNTSKVPSAWKTGLVSVLYKKDDKDLTANYRGLTLLSTIGKVFERVLLARLTAHVEGRGLMHELQYGFRKERGCEELVFALQQTIEPNPNCCACFVDVRRAYPTVYRPGLLAKLAQKGVTGKVWTTL